MQQPGPAAIALPDYASWLPLKAVAERLGVTAHMVNKWIIRGIKTEAGRIRLRAAKVGGLWRVNPEWVVEFVAASTAAALPKSANPGDLSAPLTELPRVRADVEEARVSATIDRLRNRGISSPAARRRVAPTN